jgi:hypothetical protein
MFEAARKLFKQARLATAEKVEFEGYDPTANEWHNQNILSPDVWQLEQYQWQLIFVSDDLKRGGRNHELIADAARDNGDPIHPSCYTSQEYFFFKKDLGKESFGIPLEQDAQP